MRRRVVWIATAGGVIVALALTVAVSVGQTYSREELIEDVRALASIIEDAHPDPYIRGGGKVAFHRRLHATLAAVPEEGMTREEVYGLIRPFVAAIGDAHTVVHGAYSHDYEEPGGVPLYFDIVGDELYVLGVSREDERELIGARLVSVEGVPVTEMARRLERLRPTENEYETLGYLAKDRDLWHRAELSDLLPEWVGRESVTVVLRHPDGAERERVFPLPRKMSYPLITRESRVMLPSTDRCDFVYAFLDRERTVALLRVTGMMRYREALEMWRNIGSEDREQTGRHAYQLFHGKKPPDDYDEVLAGVPSATEVFRSLVREMKEAGTKALIVDLRENSGGNSYMSNILTYFLYGKERLLSRPPATEIKRYSEYYFRVNESRDLVAINEERDVPLTVGDYDFSLDAASTIASPELRARREATLRLMDTFAAELDSGGYDGYYLPEHVIVVSSPWTFSSGWTMMRYLYISGATIVGTPSGQAGNCFGDIMPFKLPHTGLSGNVSHKWYELFPDDPETGRVLRPHHPMTYEKLAAFGFDKHAGILLALEVAGITMDEVRPIE